MNFNNLTKKLYEFNLFNSRGLYALDKTVTDKGTWKLIGIGITVYGSPVLYRYLTGDSTLPCIPKLPATKYTSSNLIEKLIVNYIAPGGVGGALSEKFFEHFKGEKLKGKIKYLARLPGTLLAIGSLTSIQMYGLAHEVWKSFPTGLPWEPKNLQPFNWIYGTFGGLTAKDTYNFLKKIKIK
ncbi:MAG: hypothetical protein J7J93_00070 [Candidatus Aenigmarchaeota archaeon]|nr:hypothetical protein [Candidatus Aenigmarchaeota archaeon]